MRAEQEILRLHRFHGGRLVFGALLIHANTLYDNRPGVNRGGVNRGGSDEKQGDARPKRRGWLSVEARPLELFYCDKMPQVK